MDFRSLKNVNCPEGECIFNEICDCASPENIKKLWESNLNALEESLVNRKDVNIPYELIKVIEWFAWGLLRKRVVEDSSISKKMAIRSKYGRRHDVYPIRILTQKPCNCSDGHYHPDTSKYPWVETY